jgi:hypothetical protein
MEPEESGGVEAGGSDRSSFGGSPGWSGLLAAVVVLVIGGFALSRDYGVQSIPSPPNFEEIATPTTLSTAGPSTSTTTAPEVADTAPPESVDPVYDDWVNLFQDLAVSPDGAIYAVAPGVVARQWPNDVDWELLDVDALPTGTGLHHGPPGRVINQVAAGPSTDVWSGVWFSGYSTSDADDEEFGGYIDGWTGGRILQWVARYHCAFCNEWTVWTSNEVPELRGGIGDLVVAGDGTVYASVGENLLMRFGGEKWTAFAVPLPPGGSGVAYPWSSSLAVDNDGVVWAGSNYGNGGVLRFDGTEFTRYTTDDGLPGNGVFQVASGTDGRIWAATDALYASPETASPDEAAGVVAFDGTTWTTFTMEDGLLSNDAVIATGADGTVWAVHYEIPPYGYSKFDEIGWTTYPFDFEVGGYRAEVGSDGTLWTISDEGLVSFDGITRTFHSTPFTMFTPVDWGIHPADTQGWWIFPEDVQWGPNVYSVQMIADVRPLMVDLVEGVSGRLIWDETVVDLCSIDIRHVGDSFVHVGDIFETFEGCGSNPTAMQDAFDNYGLPEKACVAATVGGVDHEYCAPLPMAGDVSVGSEPGTVTVSLEGLEGFEGLAVDAWVVPIEPNDEWQRLGGIHFEPIIDDPFTASDMIHPPGENYISLDPSKVAKFEPGVYRFIIEAYVPSGNMYYGCEMPIQIVDGQPFAVTFTDLPDYTDSGIHWTPLDELQYPDCPN